MDFSPRRADRLRLLPLSFRDYVCAMPRPVASPEYECSHSDFQIGNGYWQATSPLQIIRAKGAPLPKHVFGRLLKKVRRFDV